MTHSDTTPGRDFVAAVLGVDTDQPDEQHLGRQSGWWREFWTALAGRAGAGTDLARSRPDDDHADKAGASHSTTAPSGATIAAPPDPDPHADEDIPAADPPRFDSPSASAGSAVAPRHRPADDEDPELNTAADISAHSGVPVLLNAAGRGDQDAWAEIVRRYGPEVHRVARGALPLEADVQDVIQITWLRLFENLPVLDRMHDQKELGAWLSTVTRREGLRILRRRGSHPAEVAGEPLVPDDASDVEWSVGDAETTARLWAAIARLPKRDQVLLSGAIVGDDPPTYQELSRITGLPIGSLGPTRARTLRKLRRMLEESGDAPVTGRLAEVLGTAERVRDVPRDV